MGLYIVCCLVLGILYVFCSRVRANHVTPEMSQHMATSLADPWPTGIPKKMRIWLSALK